MSKTVPVLLSLALAGLAGCASQQSSSSSSPSAAPPPATAAPAASPYGPTRTVKSKDGRYDGEIVGTVAAGSRFSKLHIGMTYEQVTAAIGAPDNMARHETGKRWIPFYYGNDSQRMQVLYRNEGCLTFTGGNVFGGGGNELIRITATPRQDCMQ
jgi:hypothetical protein